MGLAMARVRLFAVAISALVLSGTGTLAHAQSVKPKVTVTGDAFSTHEQISPEQAQFGPAAPKKSLQWDDKGKWGLKLDVEQPIGRDVQMKDIQAGAYFRVTPSLRVGGAVALGGDSPVPDRKSTPQDQAPRVRLETSFKF